MAPFGPPARAAYKWWSAMGSTTWTVICSSLRRTTGRPGCLHARRPSGTRRDSSHPFDQSVRWMDQCGRHVLALSYMVTTATTPRTPVPWPPILALTGGIMTLVASEFLPASVLPELARELEVTEGLAGQAVAATAIAGAATAPTIAAVVGTLDRRIVLTLLLAVCALSNLTVALAGAFWVVLIARVLLGVSLAGVWAFAFSSGLRIAPTRPATVSTTLSVGVTIATVVVVPLTTLGSQELGWRATFGIAAVVAAAAATTVWLLVPPVPAEPGAGFTVLRATLRSRTFVVGIICIGLIAFGNFSGFTYIRVAIEAIEPATAPWLLLAFGLGGLFGNLVGGAMHRRLGFAVVAAALVLGAAMIATGWATTIAQLAVFIALWGFAFSMIPVTTQLWVTRAQPDRTEAAMSMQVFAFQVAIATGAAVGGAMVDGAGIAVALVSGGAIAMLAGLAFAFVRLPAPR